MQHRLHSSSLSILLHTASSKYFLMLGHQKSSAADARPKCSVFTYFSRSSIVTMIVAVYKRCAAIIAVLANITRLNACFFLCILHEFFLFSYSFDHSFDLDVMSLLVARAVIFKLTIKTLRFVCRNELARFF